MTISVTAIQTTDPPVRSCTLDVLGDPSDLKQSLVGLGRLDDATVSRVKRSILSEK